MNATLSSLLSTYLIDRSQGHRREVLRLYQQRRDADQLSADVRTGQSAVRLARLLNHARQWVPHYRDLLRHQPEIIPESSRQILEQLPILTRSDIQAHPQRFLSEQPGQTTWDDFTGGSSGTPLCFKVDRSTQLAREASLRWANALAGGRNGDRIAMLWGSDRDHAASLRDWRLGLRWWIDNMRWFNAFNMAEERMAEYHADLTKFRPHLIVAYAGSLFTFANYLRDHGLKPHYPVKALVSSAEILTPPMRETIEGVFGCRVFDRYGNREAGAIAAECEAHAGLHINETDFAVEVGSHDPVQEPGPLLITYLANFAMPLIRYDTGDVAAIARGPCPCGRGGLRLARVLGRQSDTIRTASGKLVHGEYFTHVLYGSRGVREFQFIQEDMRHYRLVLVCDRRDPDQERHWTNKIRDVVGRESEVVIDYVPAIPALSSGKRRFTLSKVTTAN
jgi:phenylacetate-CoA ligase